MICGILSNAGCCDCCIEIYRSKFFPVAKEKKENTHLNGVCSEISQTDHSSNEEHFNHSKRRKGSICVSCLGLLQTGVSEEAVNQISSDLIAKEYDSPSFSINISLPVCLKLRIHSLCLHIIESVSCASKICEIVDEIVSLIKERWRSNVGQKVASNINKNFVMGGVIDLSLIVKYSYADDEKESWLLEKIDSQGFLNRKKQHRKYSDKIVTRNFVDEVLNKCPDAKFREIFSYPPSEPVSSLTLSSFDCSHSSVYIAGRYIKYSRELPQTPWLVNEERRFETSVQELIATHILKIVKGDEIKFSASGREDVDVRCLGQGRPFVLEILNPRHVLLTADEMDECQGKINSNSDSIRVNDLQLVSRSEVSNLKDGEQEKTKSYCALCIARSDILPEMLKPIENITDLVLHQMTPLRVLHRRPLATRDRKILKMSSSYVSKRLFKINLTTEAGTYIKEFVHGDFNRTQPNINTMLGVEVDIVALDVTKVELDWPPPVNKSIDTYPII